MPDCTTCQKNFDLHPQETDFIARTGYPAPRQCPDCRLLWLTQWRNEQTLYPTQCSQCQQPMISRYHPDRGYRVYCHACFLSDNWNGTDYGRPYDFSKTFTENFADLLRDAPKHCTHISNYEKNVNSEYINLAGIAKNCYLVFNSSVMEDAYYSRGLHDCRDVVDCYACDRLEIGYENVGVNSSYAVFYSRNCQGCRDCWFCSMCVNCTDCFGCVNLVNQKYHWFNEALSESEYRTRLEQLLGSHQALTESATRFATHLRQYPRRENVNQKTVDSVGNYLVNCKGAYHCLESQGIEDCAYGYSLKPNARDCQNCFGYGLDSELLYHTVAVGESYRVSYSSDVAFSENVEYSFECKKIKNCFGCTGLYQGGEYCILNTHYSPKEYQTLRQKIVDQMRQTGEWGLFLSPRLCPFAHNESVSAQYFPLAANEATTRGLRWEEKTPGTFGQETITANELPDSIADVPDSYIQKILACERCHKNYKIIPQELAFYRRHQLPIPRSCFSCRHTARVAIRGPWRPTEQRCSRCQTPIQAYGEPGYTGRVYCEQCFQKEVY